LNAIDPSPGRSGEAGAGRKLYELWQRSVGCSSPPSEQVISAPTMRGRGRPTPFTRLMSIFLHQRRHDWADLWGSDRLGAIWLRRVRGPLAALYSSELWMSGFVASRSGDVLRPSRRSCTVAERDGHPKGKFPVLLLPSKPRAQFRTTIRCNMIRGAPISAVPWRATRTRVNQPSNLAPASTIPVTNAAVLKNRKMSLRTFAIGAPRAFSGAPSAHPSILTKK